MAQSLCKTGLMSSLPVGEARNRFSEVLDQVERTHERVTITRHGRQVAVLLAADDLEALEETVAVLTTPGAAAAIQQGEADADAGRVTDWDDLRETLGLPKTTDRNDG